ncbi:hypothetical protein D1007_50376 [Hordeum vulgare]|nr:hypothetical protein D1007_50376 [Hordeum vulgare]
MICLQESKLAAVSDADTREIVGNGFDSHVALPAQGTRGGILLCWRGDRFRASSVNLRSFSMTVSFCPIGGGEQWSLTTVYAPHDAQIKQAFLNELADIHNTMTEPWLQIGDFNLITDPRDKSNNRICRTWMTKFRRTLNRSCLHELQLIGRRFTWSNEQTNPTLVRPDRAFCNVDWEMLFPMVRLLPQASGISDHCPLLLINVAHAKTNRRFRFESYWHYIAGFHQVVAQSWNEQAGQRCPLTTLDLKLRQLSKALQRWSRTLVGDVQRQLATVTEIILQLDAVQDLRQLSASERGLRANLKSRSLGLAVLLKIKIRQRSRVMWLKAGDANTKFFQRKANARRNRNLIHVLHGPAGAVSTTVEMHKLAHDHFLSIFGTQQPTATSLNWEALDLDHVDLSDLEEEFSLEEIKEAINDMPTEKAPGPDGFSGGFFRACWEVIKLDVQVALQQLHQMDSKGMQRVNTGLIVLIPKKPGAHVVNDFRPISLIHSLMKLFTKILARRLSPKMEFLVNQCQSAFISIQENFLYIQNTLRHMYRTKKPSVLLKLDIAKAFDSVSWTYILNMLQARGFGERWREWIAMLLCTSSSRILINGEQSDPIRHHRGLRQGDPISPFLFILAMEPMQRLFDLATEDGVLSPLPGRRKLMRCSFYANDVAIFINQVETDARMVKRLLDCFGPASGLHINCAKSSAFPVRCAGLDLSTILAPLNIMVKTLPTTYLGLPLSLKGLTKAQLDPFILKFASRSACWKGNLMAKSGRLVLLKANLIPLAMYWMSVFKLPIWAQKLLVRSARAWLWAGSDSCTGGQCKVGWNQICRPKHLGGLGVLNLKYFGAALRLRWLWLAWHKPDRPWVRFSVPCDSKDRSLFSMATTITIGDGRSAQFWNDRWLFGECPKVVAPGLYKIATRKNRSVHDALFRDTWLNDLAHGLTEDMTNELSNLANRVDRVMLQVGQQDEITWRFATNGEYSPRSAYALQFEGTTSRDGFDLI